MTLAVEQLHVTAAMRGGAKTAIVRGLSFSVERGEKLAIVGRSGCGKTMTAMAILGLLPDNCAAAGRICFEGQELLALGERQRRALRGVKQVLIPQSGADFLNPSLRVRTQMREALLRAGTPRKQMEETMTALLARMGFEDPRRVLESYPFQLSGGMAQRVVMAMASAGNPSLVIADEPTRGVDRENTAQFLQNLDALFGGAAVLLITHDISVAARCDRILVMNEGKMVECGESGQILHRPKEIYTHELICDLPHALSHAERGLL